MKALITLTKVLNLIICAISKLRKRISFENRCVLNFTPSKDIWKCCKLCHVNFRTILKSDYLPGFYILLFGKLHLAHCRNDEIANLQSRPQSFLAFWYEGRRGHIKTLGTRLKNNFFYYNNSKNSKTIIKNSIRFVKTFFCYQPIGKLGCKPMSL